MDELVCIIAGSKSDDDIVVSIIKNLNELGVKFSRHTCSAHRDPERLRQIITDAEAQGCRVFICVAGMAAHLPGVVASQTLCPVIGVPSSGSKLNGLDALLSIAQMPRGVPVATVAIDGGANAAILACHILATNPEHADLRNALEHMRQRAREI
jgi:5-(carboxyamino)imidazole ribonucleotide mutase